MSMSTDAKWTIGTVLTVALALAALILQQAASLRADMRDINGRLGALELRVGRVEGLLEGLGLSGKLSQSRPAESPGDELSQAGQS